MHDNLQGLDLTFPAIPIGKKETPVDLKNLLYKGGASIRLDQVNQAIYKGLLTDLHVERIELVRLIHEYINGALLGGGSPETARRQISEVTRFFGWADKFSAVLNTSNFEKSYIDWTEHLLYRFKVVKEIKQITAYNSSVLVGRIVDGVLARAKPIQKAVRIRRPKSPQTPQGAKTDKQNLREASAFGRLLQDICDGTPLNMIRGNDLVSIPLQQGGDIKYALSGPNLASRRAKDRPAQLDPLRRSCRTDSVYKTNVRVIYYSRTDLFNLRIQAELLMFIGQTGMNLAQATNIPLRRFSYSSDINGYRVREYKKRRQGEVLFEIFSEYRGHIERYLEWRRELVSDSEKRLFPLIRKDGTRVTQKISFACLKTACEQAGVAWTAPSILRGTRVNWLLRRTGDPDLTAEMAQHHKQTLLRNYEKPSLQRAVSEIIRFYLHTDPTLEDKNPLLAAAPGKCDGVAKTSSKKPQSAPEPDCLRPSGCLWCEHHRDIDSLDYVWSLACFRHLKILELSRILPAKTGDKTVHPAEHTIQRLGEKLSWFRKSNATRYEWVEESLARVEEGYYHDDWSYLIQATEASSK